MDQVSEAHVRDGWAAAIALADHLAAGKALPAVGGGSSVIGDGPIHLDAVLGYARYYATDVIVEVPEMFVVGPPIMVLAAAVWIARRRGRAQDRAGAAATPQWRNRVAARTVVTPDATWCRLDGRWFAFPHGAVVDYVLDGMTIVMTFPDCAPLALTGPAAWMHAVIFARARYGDPGWQDAPWLPARLVGHP